MKRFLYILPLVWALLLLGCAPSEQMDKAATQVTAEPMGAENIAYKWGEMALQATANDTERFNPRPTVTSRYLGLIFVAIFDCLVALR